MSTIIYTGVHKSKMAMKLGSQYKFKDTSMRDFEKLADVIGFRREFLYKQIDLLVGALLREGPKLRDELNSDPVTTSLVYEEILLVLRQQIKKICPAL
jgi:hypothetical protein